MNPTSIRYISRAELDVQLWDKCISSASNGLIYTYSLYLDKMAKQWDALVLDEYKMVMPLTWNKKAGIYYLYQPAFTPSLGIFGNNISAQIVQEFIECIPERFRLIEISLNRENHINELKKDHLKLMMRKNYVLSLDLPYEKLYDRYNENIRRNIKKSVALGCIVKKNINIEEVAELAKSQLVGLTNLKEDDYANFISLYNDLASQNRAVTYAIVLDGQVLSSAAYFFSHGRAYYILVGNHPNGKTMGTSHYLIDRFIADYAGRDLLLDFEGSDIESLAFFYSSFGADIEHFPSLKMNRLPWYAKPFKR